MRWRLYKKKQWGHGDGNEINRGRAGPSVFIKGVFKVDDHLYVLSDHHLPSLLG